MTEHRPAAPLFLRHDLHKVVLEFYRVAVFAQTQPAAKPNNMRIARNTLRIESITEQYIRRLPSDAGKFYQFLHGIGNPAAVLLDDRGTCSFDILRWTIAVHAALIFFALFL